jgi:tryptophanyl-tRNA synthetase
MRPTGRLHIGHYFGALQNWVRLQGDPAYECFYFVADWHALTSDYADTSAIAENSLQISIDFLAAGLDPEKSVIFLQSLVPEHAELHLLLSMITPLGELERIPTYKEALENVTDKDLHTYGFLGYPTLQTADIVMYSEPGTQLFVPVGEDQVSHVEFSRQIVSRFNFFYGLSLDNAIFDSPNEVHLRELYDRASTELIQKESWKGRPFVDHFDFVLKNVALKAALENATRRIAQKAGIKNFQADLGPEGKFFKFTEVLTEPDVLLTQTPRIPGLDGRKMSKSYGNSITLSETDAEIRAKTKVMVTDPARKRRTDPGNPDICPVYDWHKLFSPKETLEWVAEGCRTAGIGCIECKAKMADHLIRWIEPVRERRLAYEQKPKAVLEILDAGSAKARESARRTMERVRDAVFHWGEKRGEMG